MNEKKKRDWKQEEQQRELTPQEQKRVAHFREMCAQLEAQGYIKTEVTIGIVMANVVACVAVIPVLALGLGLFFIVNPEGAFAFGIVEAIIALLAVFLLIVVHEALHGATWAIFAPNHVKDIEFGFMKQYLTPYCTCLSPLRKGQYILGALMPLFVLGLLPTIVGIAAGYILVTFVGLVMILAAMGDIIIVVKMLATRTPAGDVLYADHPTQAGFAMFVR